MEDLGELPRSYGTDSIFLVAQEPHWLFTYWDIDISLHPGGKTFLRVTRGADQIESEIEVPFETRNWYIPVGHAGSEYTVEIGYYRGSQWKAIATSITIRTPQDKVSDSDKFDYATIPLHMSFQKLMDNIHATIEGGETLIQALGRLQRDGKLLSLGGGRGMTLSPDEKVVLEALLGKELFEELSNSVMNSEELSSRIQKYLGERLHSGGASELLSGIPWGVSESSLFSALTALASSSSWSSAALSSWAAAALTSWAAAAKISGSSETSWSAAAQSSWGAEVLSSWLAAAKASGVESSWNAAAFSSWLEAAKASGIESSWNATAFSSWLAAAKASGIESSWNAAALSSWLAAAKASGVESSWNAAALSSWLQAATTSWAGAALSSWSEAALSSWSQAALSSWSHAETSSWGGSENIGSFGFAKREFFMHVNAEVIFYGGTHPDAKVTVDGKPIELGPDGTFRYHFVFPDGCYEIPIVAVSPDGVETRSATLRLERGTSRAGDVGHTAQPPLAAPMGATA